MVERDGAHGVVRVDGGVDQAQFFGERAQDFGVERGLDQGGIRQYSFPGFARAGEGGVAATGGFVELELHQALAFAGDDELRIVDQAHAVLGGEALGAGADEVDVRGFFEDETRGLDGVAEPLDAGDATGAKVGPIHEERV